MSNAPKSNFNAAVILNVAASRAIAKDPAFGQKVADALQGSLMGSAEDRIIKCTYKDQEVMVGHVIATHQADQVRLVATGNDTGVDLGAAGGVENLKEENIRKLFEDGLEKFDLVVRQEAVRKPKTEGAPATATTEPASKPTEGGESAAS